MKHIVAQLGDALKSANSQMALAAACIREGRQEEALLHLDSMGRLRAAAIEALGNAEKALASLDNEVKKGREARIRASGMAGLLGEILGKGALSAYGDEDLVERVEMAVSAQADATRQAAGVAA